MSRLVIPVTNPFGFGRDPDARLGVEARAALNQLFPDRERQNFYVATRHDEEGRRQKIWVVAEFVSTSDAHLAPYMRETRCWGEGVSISEAIGRARVQLLSGRPVWTFDLNNQKRIISAPA